MVNCYWLTGLPCLYTKNLFTAIYLLIGAVSYSNPYQLQFRLLRAAVLHCVTH